MGALIGARKRSLSTAVEEDALLHSQLYLTFTVAHEVFALTIAVIKEIIEYRAPTTVPMMPPFIRGIINLRGRVVPVIDLSVRFGHAKGEVTRRTCIVILEIREGEQQHDIGVVVDAVSAVLDIADADVEPPPSFGARLRSDFIGGMGKIGEKFVIILDIEHVLSMEELSLLGDSVAPRTRAQTQAAELSGPEQNERLS